MGHVLRDWVDVCWEGEHGLVPCKEGADRLRCGALSGMNELCVEKGMYVAVEEMVWYE